MTVTSPPAGKDASRPTLQPRTDETAADERIVHILTEASHAMKSESVPPPGGMPEEQPASEARSPSRQVRRYTELNSAGSLRYFVELLRQGFT